MVQRGFILRELIKRDFKSRYVGSTLGVGWALLHPFWQMLLYSFVFGLVMKVPPPEDQTSSFAVFLFAGLVPWLAMQEGINRSAHALTDNAELIKKLSFPPELLVVSNTVGGLIQSGLAAVVLLVVLIVRGELSPFTVPLLVAVLPFQVALTIGLGLLFAALNVFLRDTAQVLTIALNAWFFVTPIVYPLALIDASTHPEVRALIEANPLTAIVELYRFALMGGGGFLGHGLWILGVGSLLMLGAGWWLFGKLQPAFADEL